MKWTSPTQTAICLRIKDSQFVVSVTMRNLSDEPVNLHTMTGRLMSVEVNEKRGDDSWTPQTGTTMATSYWELEAGAEITSRWTIPNEETAQEKKEEMVSELEVVEEDDPMLVPFLDPNEKRILIVEASVPTAGSSYSQRVSRMYDLRTNPERALDDVPEEDMSGINRL